MTHSIQQLFNSLEKVALDKDFKINNYKVRKSSLSSPTLVTTQKKLKNEQLDAQSMQVAHTKKMINFIMCSIIACVCLYNSATLFHVFNIQTLATFKTAFILFTLVFIYKCCGLALLNYKYMRYYQGLVCNCTIKLSVLAEILKKR